MQLIFRYPHFIVLLIAFLAADIAVSFMIRLAHRVGANDSPDAATYKTQKKPVPYLGGIGLFIGLIVALMTTLDWSVAQNRGFKFFFENSSTNTVIATLLGGTCMAILGLLDDLQPIHALVKLAVLIVVTIGLSALGLVLNTTPWFILNFILTLFWIVGVISSFNAIDNTDGVAGITASSIAFWTFLVAWGRSALDAQVGQSFLAIALFGATLGFLRHNRPSARVYLGNSGSFLLGFVVAVMAVSGTWAPTPLQSSLAPLMLAAYPVFDISYTIFMRWKAGVVKNPLQAVVVSGRDHTAHRLQAMGLSPFGVLGVIGFLNLLGGLAATFAIRYSLDSVWLIILSFSLLLVYLCFGWAIRNAIDLHSPQACITHRDA